MEIKFKSDDNYLPLSKKINIPVCVIVVKSVVKKDDRYYPQFFCMNFVMSMNMKIKKV